MGLKEFVMVALFAVFGFGTGAAVKYVVQSTAVSSETVNVGYQQQQLPPVVDVLTIETPKLATVKKTLILETENTVVLRGPVTGSSVSQTMKRLQTISRTVSKDTPIYLVLDTPGGSVPDGLDLIDFASALPQKIHTVTLFAASMGFQIAQNLDTRYIIRNGTFMSHRAKVDGMGGQIKGEFESRYKMLRRSIDALDLTAATRLGISMKQYEDLIFNEYWVFGFDAVSAKVADEQVLVKCGASMRGSEDMAFDTVFGKAVVTFSQCPLIKTPENISFAGIRDHAHDGEVRTAITQSLEDKVKFIRNYLDTDKFFEVFK